MKIIKIIIVGGGFGGIYTLKKLHKLFHRNPNIEITLISKKNYFLFTPLLHEVATGGINPSNIIEPIRKILGCCLNNFYVGEISKINLKERKIEMVHNILDYDYLVLAPGATNNFYNISGAEENSFTLKTLDDAIKLKNHCIDIIDKASFIKDEKEKNKMLRFVIVGAGPTGVELAAEMQEFLEKTFAHYYPKDLIKNISVNIIQRDKQILSQLSKSLQEKSLKVLEKKGVKVFLNAVVKNVTKDSLELESGEILETKTVVWGAGVKPAKVPFVEEVDLENNGRIKVNQYLQLEKFPFIYALGDVAGLKSKDGILVPMLAQVAVKEAEIVAENLKCQINEQVLWPFNYKSAGSFISLGKWMAVGEIHNFKISGYFAWWVWRTIYLSKLISWQKKVKVAVDWTVNAFSSRDISRL